MKRFLRGLYYAAVTAISLFSAVLFGACFWSVDELDIGMNEIVNTMVGPLEGTGYGPVLSAAKVCVPFVLLVVVTLALDFRADRKLEKTCRTKSNEQGNAVPGEGAEPARTKVRKLRRLSLCGSFALLFLVLLYCNAMYDVIGFVSNRMQESTLYDEQYVKAEDTEITADGATKNLIYIYMESFETTYASKDKGGAQDNNFIPNLTALAEENISFSATCAPAICRIIFAWARFPSLPEQVP